MRLDGDSIVSVFGSDNISIEIMTKPNLKLRDKMNSLSSLSIDCRSALRMSSLGEISVVDTIWQENEGKTLEEKLKVMESLDIDYSKAVERICTDTIEELQESNIIVKLQKLKDLGLQK